MYSGDRMSPCIEVHREALAEVPLLDREVQMGIWLLQRVLDIICEVRTLHIATQTLPLEWIGQGKLEVI